MDNQDLIYAVETATVALERIAAALEVIAGAKRINSILTDRYDSIIPMVGFGNVQKEESSSLVKAPEEGQAPVRDRNTTTSRES